MSQYCYVDIAPVHYVQRNSSINHSTDLKTLDILKVLDDILDDYKKNHFYQQYYKELEYLTIRIILCSSFSRICHMNQKTNRKKALHENYLYLQRHFPVWKKNPILKKQKSHQALFMKSVNRATYPFFSILFPTLFRFKERVGRK